MELIDFLKYYEYFNIFFLKKKQLMNFSILLRPNNNFLSYKRNPFWKGIYVGIH